MIENGINYNERVTALCMERFGAAEPVDILTLADRIMSDADFPMHHPVHHYLVPAVLLTACRKAQGHGAEVLARDLAEAEKRASNVLGGFCGFYGACGACVGVGIFWSLITDSTPLSVQTWGYANAGTAAALAAVAEYGGPRCCKRCSFLSLQSALPVIRARLGLALPEGGSVRCAYSARNKECLRERCPFHEEA